MTHKIAHQLGIKLSGDETSTEVEELIVKQLETVPYIQYPTAFHTVDIIATRNVESTVDGNLEVLLGRKHNATQWVFIGGFVEPTQTAEAAALRELHEETNILIENEKRLAYLGSLFIDDARYKDSCHKITTSLFTIRLTSEEATAAKGGDDIEIIDWFKINDVSERLSEHHKPLFEKFIKYQELLFNIFFF
jgi:bifunctional NMN adenylyltransferase/nudix hydrolase